MTKMAYIGTDPIIGGTLLETFTFHFAAGCKFFATINAINSVILLAHAGGHFT